MRHTGTILGKPSHITIAEIASALLVAAAIALQPMPAMAAKSGSKAQSSSHHSGKASSSKSAPHVPSGSSRKASNVKRNSSGRIERDPAARRSFRKSHPCPSTGRSSGACPGYVVDHVMALKRGGPDSPSNMQWQSVSEARRKDRVE